MRVLAADDDRTALTILSGLLEQWHLEVSTAADGLAAWQQLQQPDPPSLAILDWEMPGLDGVEVCRRVRANPATAHLYVVLLTARDSRADLVQGLDAGADDYVTKPFHLEELRARVQVGIRVARLQENLSDRVAELQVALSRVKQLSGLLPICSYCKRIRSDSDYWEQVESYIAQHSDARFSHGICPPCYENVMTELDAEREAIKARGAGLNVVR
jgi:sigma-B regulation protein RsbU (phosphoserine phosphatase)